MKNKKNMLFILFCAYSGICMFYAHTARANETEFNASFGNNIAEDSVTPEPGTLIASNVYATGYYCIYNCEMDGFQTVTSTISGNTYNLKASFLFGGYGIAMQGTGRTGPDGEYVKYNGGGGCFVRISGPDAGKNLRGKYVENPKTIRKRYAKIGINDFTGFGNLALTNPQKAIFSISSQIYGSTGCVLEPWSSIAADPLLITPGQSCMILFENETAAPNRDSLINVAAVDTGGIIKGRHIDIYLGEGKAAWNAWLSTGGNRYVDIYKHQILNPKQYQILK